MLPNTSDRRLTFVTLEDLENATRQSLEIMKIAEQQKEITELKAQVLDLSDRLAKLESLMKERPSNSSE